MRSSYVLFFAGLFVIALSVQAQVEAKSLKVEKPPLQVIESPMQLDVGLAGDGTSKKPHIVDLPPNRTRLVRDTAQYVCDKLTVQAVSVRRKPGRKVVLEVTPVMETEYYRQKTKVTVVLMNGDQMVKTWSGPVTLGLTAGAVFGGGAFALANPDKTAAPNVEFSFASEEELRQKMGGPEAKVRVIVEIVGTPEEEEEEED